MTDLQVKPELRTGAGGGNTARFLSVCTDCERGPGVADQERGAGARGWLREARDKRLLLFQYSIPSTEETLARTPRIQRIKAGL